METAAVSFFVITAAAAITARYMRCRYEEDQSFNKNDRIIPLEGTINRLQLTIQDDSTVFVKSEDLLGNPKILYKILRTGTNWHLYTCNNKNSQKLVSTLNNSTIEKFIVLNNSDSYSRQSSPLNTSISIMKLNFNWFRNLVLSHNWWFQTEQITDFSFGSEISVCWVGLRYLEIVTREKKFLFNGLQSVVSDTAQVKDTSSLINVRQRVAQVSDFDDEINGFTLAFDYAKINMEIMISTFLLALILQNHKFGKYVQMGEEIKLREVQAMNTV